MRAGQSDIIYDLFMYGGKDSAGSENCDTEGSVLCLVEELPKYQYHQPCFDNCFSTLPLLLILKGIGAGQVAASFKVN